MSKQKETVPESQDNKKTLKSSYISYINLEKNTPKQKSKSKSNITENEKDSNNSYKKKFSYMPKNSYANINKNSNPELISYNVYESKSSIINVKHPDNIKSIIQEKQKSIALSNKIEKNKMPIFIKKIPIENDLRQKKNTMIINKEIKRGKIIDDNIINKGYMITTSRSKRTLPIKYQLYLDNNNNINNFICYNNNSIMISNNSKGSNETKTKIIKLEDKFDFTKNIETEKGKIINFKDLSIIKDKKRTLKKTISKQSYLNYSPKNNNNFIHNILYSNKSSEKFNFDKYKKQQHITSNMKNNNFYSYQIHAPPRNVNHNNQKKPFQQLYTMNLKNNNNFQNYRKISPNKKRTYQNILQNIIENNNNNCPSDKRSKSRIDINTNESRTKNQVNNNNININNVFVNLDSMNDDYFNSTEDKSIMKDFKINKRSYSYSNIKSANKNEIIINNNQIINEIKILWKKLGGMNEQYKNKFIDKLNYLNNNDKIHFFFQEKNEIMNLLDILDKLNKTINQRKNIHMQLKNINNNNNFQKIQDIINLLITLRQTSIDIIKYFIQFKKEISYDIVNSKYKLENIINFPSSYLIHIENDTSYLSSNEYLSSLFKFSKYSDPFLLSPSKENKDKNKNYYILPINDNILEEIQKANLFLIKEKMYREIKKKQHINKSTNNFHNNAILIRNMNNIGNNNKYIFCRNIFDKLIICPKIESLDIINNEIKIFNKEKIKCCSNISNLNIIYNKKKINKGIIPCSNIFNYEYKNINFKKTFNDINITNTSNFEILKVAKKEYSISNEILNFSIPKTNHSNVFKTISISNNINILEIKPNQKNNNTNTLKENKPIPPNQTTIKNIPNNNNMILNNPNQIVCPYNDKSYPPIDTLYKAYIATVSNDIKISFKINQDIKYYLTIGVSPKIILFKENNTFLYGMATLSYDSSQINKKSLMITSISCSQNYSIINTLLQLVEYCNKNLEYDELVLYLYFYQDENKKGEYLLNEEYKNMIKTKTLFKWTALENSGNERKIKYHYKKNFDKNYIENKNSVKILNSYIHIKFYRYIKYKTGKCLLNMTPKDYTYLFNIFELIYKYNINVNDPKDELNSIFAKLQGLKKKRLLKLIIEFNYPICSTVKPFFEELGKSEDKLYSDILFKRFLGILKNIPKDSVYNSLGFFCCDISTNFSSIIKRKMNGYEYNIISINEFNIETFRLNNEINNEDYNKFIYFFKSQNKSISFLIYELDLNEEKNINDINYKKNMFYKILKRILTKDNDEPVKIYKKIGIPSFKYYIGVEKENDINVNKIADYDILDGNDWFNFCIENNNEDNLFSFPEQNINNEDNNDIKIINNSFIIAIINPELTVDYQIPALNIYYINKNCWNKR